MRARRILTWIAAVIIGLPLLFIVVVLIGANLGPGQRLIETVAAKATGGTVLVQGLHGRFPDRLRVNQVTLRDTQGVWLEVDGAALDWSPTSLVTGTAYVNDLRVTRIAVVRQPVPASAQPASARASSSNSDLPVRVVIDHLQLDRIDVGAALAGQDIALSLRGQARIDSLQAANATVDARSIDGQGQYALRLNMDAQKINAALNVHEPVHGLIAGLAKLPDLGGPIAMQASLNGLRQQEALAMQLAAGALHADATGTVNVQSPSGTLAINADAPAMAPRADLSWQSISVHAHLQGDMAHPAATGQIQIVGLNAGGAGMQKAAMNFQADRGRAQMRAELSGLRLPGPSPDVLAAAPLVLSADAQLDAPARPVHFHAAHPLLQLDGTAETGTRLAADATLVLPDLQPLAAIGKTDVRGSTSVTANMTTEGQATQIAVQGAVAITGGMPQLVGLIGKNGNIEAAATLQGNDIVVQSAKVDGATVHLTASGADRGSGMQLDWQLMLSDLSALASSINGKMQMTGHAAGQHTDLTVNADLQGELGAPGIPRGPLTAHLHATGLPGLPDATLEANGTLDRAPLRIAATVSHADDGGLRIGIRQINWKANRIAGDFMLPSGATLPRGNASLALNLADFRPFIGMALAGDIKGTVQSGADNARVNLVIAGAGIPAARVGHAVLDAHVTNPTGNAAVTAALQADGIEANGIAGNARVQVNGPQNALAIRLATALHNLIGADASANAAATLDLPGKNVALSALQANWHGENLRLVAPTRISFGDTISVTPLRLSVGGASVNVAGKIKPALDLTASVQGVTPELARPFAPDLRADGTISADAKLTGTLAAPSGHVSLVANHLHMLTGPASGLPPADLHANATLRGKDAQVDAMLQAGNRTHLAVNGRAPLDKAGPVDLHATGGVDLALLDPVLTPQGRRLRGTINLDMTVTGTPTAPRPNGTVRLANVEVQDFGQGVHISDLNGVIQADGQQVRIANLQGRAGTGTISMAGTIGALDPSLPLDLKIIARDAQPLASDQLTARIDADMTVQGAVRQKIALGGKVVVKRAEINLPEHLPVSVAVLNVQKPGQKPPPPPAPGPDINLALELDAPGNAIFVRGRGLDAVLGGRLHLSGDTKTPQVVGGFVMQRGTFSLAGASLNFTHGRVSFNGTGVTRKIDPSLDFEADSVSDGVVAKLLVGGYASAPKITLASEPTLPQDEVLAHLLFGTNVQQLSPFQIASIAEGLATLSGVGGGGPGALDRVRSGLGLDRLSVGSDTGNSVANSIPDLNQRRSSGTNTTSIQAGRYIANGVYVGAKQGTSGTDTQAEVQIDITKRLKAESDLGSGRGDNNVGITYQFEY